MSRNPVRGQLNREENPLPNEKPGYTPQYFGADGHAIDVSPDNPYPTGNYIQNDSGVWLPVSQDNPVPTQVTGSTVEEVVIAERAVRTDRVTRNNLVAPNGVKGAALVVRVYGITGTNPSIAARLDQRIEGASPLVLLSLDIDSPGTKMFVFHPGATKEDLVQPQSTFISGIPFLAKEARVDLSISGSFDSEEGIDYSASLIWIK